MTRTLLPYGRVQTSSAAEGLQLAILAPGANPVLVARESVIIGDKRDRYLDLLSRVRASMSKVARSRQAAKSSAQARSSATSRLLALARDTQPSSASW